MATVLSMKELRNMQVADLRRDVACQRELMAKLSLGIKLQKEKGTAKLKRERKSLARMMTALNERNETMKRNETSKRISSESSLSSPFSSKEPALKKGTKKPKISTPES